MKQQNTRIYLGIDIGSSAVKAVRLQGDITGIQLTDIGCIPFSRPVLQDGRIHDPAAIVEALASMAFLSAGDTPPAAVCASLPGLATTTRFTTLPESSPQEFYKLLQSDAQTYCDPEAHLFAAKLLQERPPRSPEADGVPRRGVMLLMAERAVLQEYTDVLQHAGLANVAMSVDLLACAKAFANQIHLSGEAGDKTAIIHLGAQSTILLVLKSGQVIFTRSMRNDPTRDLAENTVAEAGRSFAYFLEQSGEGSISRVLLSGGPVGDSACFDVFRHHLGIPVERGNPLVDLDLPVIQEAEANRITHQLVVAIGLGLIGLQAHHLTRLSAGIF